MRQLPTLAVLFLSLAAGFALAWATYRHAWQIPLVNSLRGTQLFCALWIIATPLAGLLAVLGRVATWRATLKSGAIFLGVAVPAFGLASSLDQVRHASRDKAILCNLRQLAAAADQYFLENGVTAIRHLEDLVGPDKYIKALNPVTGEDYGANFPFRQGGVLSADYPSSKILNYNTGDDFPGYKDVFAPGEVPPWRASRPGSEPPTTDRQARPGTSHTARPSEATPTTGTLPRLFGRPRTHGRNGLVCANCHPRKN